MISTDNVDKNNNNSDTTANLESTSNINLLLQLLATSSPISTVTPSDLMGKVQNVINSLERDFSTFPVSVSDFILQKAFLATGLKLNTKKN
ncbi:hypothetical protein RCL_jg6445.t1 [Rhizophagus clarus]|uniref:Uncharacterized protein n=1 Tax=Rhizophagus clarus TaxID=94130 RepID=A0A8H3LGB5_9GLOM|nr:hypothetical protein RCL_jg6445.t1 [Rhizophagus clarus]